jgi:hypothetical protein
MTDETIILDGDASGLFKAVQQANAAFESYNKKATQAATVTARYNAQQEQVAVSVKRLDAAGKSVTTTYQRIADAEGNLTDQYRVASQTMNRTTEATNKLKAAREKLRRSEVVDGLKKNTHINFDNLGTDTKAKVAGLYNQISQLSSKMSGDTSRTLTRWMQEVQKGTAKFEGEMKGPIQRLMAEADKAVRSESEKKAKLRETEQTASRKAYNQAYKDSENITKKQLDEYSKLEASKRAAAKAEQERIMQTAEKEIAAQRKRYADIAKERARLEAQAIKEVGREISTHDKLEKAKIASEKKTAKTAAETYARTYSDTLLRSSLAQLPTGLDPKTMNSQRAAIQRQVAGIRSNIERNQFSQQDVMSAQAGTATSSRLAKLSSDFSRLRASILGAAQAKEVFDAKTAKLASSLNFEKSNLANLLFSWEAMGRLLAIQLLHTAIGRVTSAISAGVTAATAYQRKLTQIRTIAQDNQLSFQAWDKMIQRVARSYGTTLADTAQAAYSALSNQVARGLQLETFLNSISAFAIATNSSLEQSGNLLASVLNSYRMTATQANEAAAILFKTIDLGRVEAGEMANTFGRVAVLATEAGVSLSELGAMISLLTIKGTKYNEAYTLINNMLLKIAKPTKEMTVFLGELGYESGLAAVRGMGLVGFLEAIDAALAKNPNRGRLMFNEMRSFRSHLSMTGQGLKDFIEIHEKYKDSELDYANAVKMQFESPGERWGKELEKLKSFFTAGVGGQIVSVLDRISTAMGGLADQMRLIVPTAGMAIMLNVLMKIGTYGVKNMMALVAATKAYGVALKTVNSQPHTQQTAADLARGKAMLGGLATIAAQVAIVALAYKITTMMQAISTDTARFEAEYAKTLASMTTRRDKTIAEERKARDKFVDEQLKSGFKMFASLTKGLESYIEREKELWEASAEHVAIAFGLRERALTSYFERLRSRTSRAESALEKLDELSNKRRNKLIDKQEISDLETGGFDPAEMARLIERLRAQGQAAFKANNVDVAIDSFDTIESVLEKVMRKQKSSMKDLSKEIDKARSQLETLRKVGQFTGSEQLRSKLEANLNELVAARAAAEGAITAAKDKQMKMLEESIRLQDEMAARQRKEREEAAEAELRERYRYETFKRRVDDINSFKFTDDIDTLDKQMETVRKNATEAKKINSALPGDKANTEYINDLLDKRVKMLEREYELRKTMLEIEQARGQLTTQRAAYESMDRAASERMSTAQSAAENVWSATLPALEALLVQYKAASEKEVERLRLIETHTAQAYSRGMATGNVGYGAENPFAGFAERADRDAKAKMAELQQTFNDLRSGLKAVIEATDPTTKATQAMELPGKITKLEIALSKLVDSRLIGGSAEEALKLISESSTKLLEAARTLVPKDSDKAGRRGLDKTIEVMQEFAAAASKTQADLERALNNSGVLPVKELQEIQKILREIRDKTAPPQTPTPTAGKLWGGTIGADMLAAGEMVMNRQASATFKPLLNAMNLNRPSGSMRGNTSIGNITINMPTQTQVTPQTARMLVGQIRDLIHRGEANLNT